MPRAAPGPSLLALVLGLGSTLADLPQWCYVSTTQIPSAFGKVQGLADDQCQVWYFAQQDTLTAVQYDMSSAAGAASLPPAASTRVLGSPSYYAGHVYAPARNATHGAVATFVRLDASSSCAAPAAGAAPARPGAPLASAVLLSEPVAAPLAWASTDYGAGVLWAAPAAPLSLLHRFQLLQDGAVSYNGTLPLRGFDGAAAVAGTVPRPGSLYVALDDGRVVSVDTKTGGPSGGGSLAEATLVDAKARLLSLANLWSLQLGTMHLLAENGTSVLHFDFC